MKIDPEFKKALQRMPSLEKDKLILRLLRKDPSLAKKLHFEMISGKSVEECRNEVAENISHRAEYFVKGFHSPGVLMMKMRDLSGTISAHLKTTKDKYGEISLTLLLLNSTLGKTNHLILKFSAQKAEKLCTYIIARAYKILILISKMHEDYRIEFSNDLSKLGMLIGQNDYLMRTAIFNGLDVNWLISGNIPEDIEQRHKDVRSQGYL